ncbi:hypothetical protein DFH09DRAFT_1075809 [Mycena vulgaris]|nr:hypothetical protein DFH09DRAFT_1075809 [Mycena vulgaris]
MSYSWRGPKNTLVWHVQAQMMSRKLNQIIQLYIQHTRDTRTGKKAAKIRLLVHGYPGCHRNSTAHTAEKDRSKSNGNYTRCDYEACAASFRQVPPVRFADATSPARHPDAGLSSIHCLLVTGTILPTLAVLLCPDGTSAGQPATTGINIGDALYAQTANIPYSLRRLYMKTALHMWLACEALTGNRQQCPAHYVLLGLRTLILSLVLEVLRLHLDPLRVAIP